MSPSGIARQIAANDLPATIVDQSATADSLQRQHAQERPIVVGVRRSAEQHRTGPEHDGNEGRCGEDEQRHDSQRISGQRRLPGCTAVDLDRFERGPLNASEIDLFVVGAVSGQPQLVCCSGAGLQQVEGRLERGDVDDREAGAGAQGIE